MVRTRPLPVVDRRPAASSFFMGSSPLVRFLTCFTLVVVASLGLTAGCRPSASSLSQRLEGAERAYREGNYLAAREMTAKILAEEPASIKALVLAGQSAHQMGDDEAALQLLGSIPNDGSPESVEGLVAAGELAYHLGRAEQAEKYWRAALESDPRHGLANGLLAYLLVLEGRSFEARPFLFEPVRMRLYPLEHLLLLGTPEVLVANEQQMRKFRRGAPEDPLPLIGQARTKMAAGEWSEARRLLDEVVAKRPGQLEAQARLGETLLEIAPESFLDWHGRLPPDAGQHPQIWVVRGLWAQRSGQSREAIRCFGEALRLEPNHQLANHRLGVLLRGQGQVAEATAFLERATALEELGRVVDDVRRNLQNPRDPTVADAMYAAAERTEELGRLWEAWAWHEQMLKTWPALTELRDAELRLRNQLYPTMPQTLVDRNPVRQIDLAAYPLPAWTASDSLAPLAAGAGAAAAIAFHNDAASAGLDFTYYSDADPDDDVVRLIETTGGGVGVLDYDNDGWPDVYLTQGAAWPPGSKQIVQRDRLFRNIGGGKFLDQTEAAGLGDESYSQGVAIGDYDNDGYDDIYVANIGPNRLYRNNGDGTFRDASGDLQTKEHYWTTSCLLADVNGDSWPDIYDVNYVANEDLHRSVCRKGDEVGGCSVGIFRAAHDRLLLNRGDGTFHDVSAETGVERPNGMGLGIVAADFQNQGRLSLFIANDAYPNFFFHNSAPLGEAPQWVEEAVPRGVALDENGKSQACMGVASGDANGDGLLDLFVTNFYREHNALYVQQQEGFFVDQSNQAGLRGPSLAVLGFGTQYLDAELDGDLDLIATNGHIFDLSDRKIPYRMRAQMFRNDGRGRFAELQPEDLGEFFQQEYLGRGLARLDWNRDGREDVVISHIDAPAALLTSATPPAGRALILKLRGRTGSRDAVGARVSVQVGDRTITRQLQAGDGYQASNQRQLLIGLGNVTEVAQLRIDWPGGSTQQFANVPLDAELLIVEGNEPVALP